MIARHISRCALFGVALAAQIIGPTMTLTAQTPPNDGRLGPAARADLQRITDQAAAQSGAAGVQVSVILGDQRADFVFGTANAELGTPMTVETVVQIGSTTKVLNAAMIMTLVDEGVLTLDRPIKEYVPNLDLMDDAAEQAISLRQLLSMTSGLDNGPYTEHGGGDDGLARYVASLATLPQAFRPGAGWGYSNAGVSIAGYAAERAAGKSWDTLLKQRILDPIGLTHAVTQAQDLPYQRVSVGHTPTLDGKPPTVIRPWYISQAQGPAGSTLAMSAQDLASFGQIFLCHGKTANGICVLTETSVAAMMTPVVATSARSFAENWCIGLGLQHWSGIPVFGHVGGNQSGTSYLMIFPEQHGVLAITVNTPATLGVFSEKVFDDFGAAVFRVTPGKLERPAIVVIPRNPERYVGTYAMLGATYQVTLDGTALTLVVTWADDENLGDSPSPERYELVPLEEGRFLMAPSAGGAGRPNDVGFFGDDGHGRATNLVAPFFPAKRVQ